MLFTPGDIVYSSSKLLNEKQPNLSVEKLSLLMSNHKITFDLIKKTIDKFKNFHVHVLGDTIVDTYTRTNFIGGQTKTPTFSVLYDRHEDYLGGAGIVSKHLRAAGAKVNFTTVLGKDAFAKFVKDDLKKIELILI